MLRTPDTISTLRYILSHCHTLAIAGLSSTPHCWGGVPSPMKARKRMQGGRHR
ncbi:hypothetical protein [Acidovorax sp.]|uniref:hypothetical protein n=1 Tax=Acidovorax sp. TaxID=1872122 RepID=UPI00391F9B7A